MLRLLAASALMAVCVSIHASGLAWAMRWLRSAADAPLRFLPDLRLFIRIAIWIVALHFVEIIVWALLFTWRGALSDFSTAVYFSAVTYTTTGYGDVVLPERWRLSSADEAHSDRRSWKFCGRRGLNIVEKCVAVLLSRL